MMTSVDYLPAQRLPAAPYQILSKQSSAGHSPARRRAKPKNCLFYPPQDV
jgi:hypothetical protein